MSGVDVFGRAEAWLAMDPDPVTVAELRAILDSAHAGDAGALADLHDRFDARLTFGTAGLRGELGAGPNRMNRLLVQQAAYGFAQFLLRREESPSVVIGYDGRVNSDVFAKDSAEIFAGLGLTVHLFPHVVPTPVTATAVRSLGLSAGVMVTASHNPPRDNGYKVYLGGADEGSQIVSPADHDIEALILEAAAMDAFTVPPIGCVRDGARTPHRRLCGRDRANLDPASNPRTVRLHRSARCRVGRLESRLSRRRPG